MNNDRQFTVSLKKRAVAHAPAQNATRLSERVVLHTPVPPGIVVAKRAPTPTESHQPFRSRRPSIPRRSYLDVFKEELEIFGNVLYQRRSSLITSVVSLLLTLISSGALVQTLFFDKPLTANAATEIASQEGSISQQ